jgi:hypothetical protein
MSKTRKSSPRRTPRWSWSAFGDPAQLRHVEQAEFADSVRRSVGTAQTGRDASPWDPEIIDDADIALESPGMATITH